MGDSPRSTRASARTTTLSFTVVGRTVLRNRREVADIGFMERQNARKSLRVLIDGTAARGGGGFTYLVNVLPRLAKLAPEQRFRVLLRNPRLAESLPELPNLEIDLRKPEAGLFRRLCFTHLEIPRIAREWGADLYFSASETAPVWASCPRIAAFRNPNVYTALDQDWATLQRLRLLALRWLSRLSAWSCQRVLFVSRDSAEWIGDALRIPRDRRCTIHHGIDTESWHTAEHRPLHTLPYILSVSSIYRYKNFVRLIEAYGELATRNPNCPDLVIIGDDQDPAYAEKMREARGRCGDLAENIHILGEIPYADIQSYYAGAEMFVFPSYLETFGHPLLEAMASGLPTVAADIPVFREVGGDAVIYADPHSAPALAKAIEQVLFTPGEAQSLAKRGRERVLDFTWEHTATCLLNLLTEVGTARDTRPRPVPTPAWDSTPAARPLSWPASLPA